MNLASPLNNDPIHETLPDCVFPLIFSGGDPEYPYGMAGTGFLVRYRSRPFFVTARHCLGETSEEIQKSVENLHLPLSPSTYGIFPLQQWGEARVAGDLPNEILPGGHFDLVVISIDDSKDQVAAAISERAINLPPTGEWFEKIEKHFKAKLPDYQEKILLEVRGFPRDGTKSQIDYEKQLIITQGIVLRGHARWNSQFLHTKSISFLHEHCPITNFDGVSGSPVFLLLKSSADSPCLYTLAGMMIRASNMCGHFVTIPWLVRAVQTAANEI